MWCEQQFYYVLKRGFRTKTKAMVAGTKIHAKVEAEIHTFVPVETKTIEDIWGMRIWNMLQGVLSLKDGGVTRELEVWGWIEGVWVTGIIDEITFEENSPSTGLDKAWSTLEPGASDETQTAKVSEGKSESAKYQGATNIEDVPLIELAKPRRGRSRRSKSVDVAGTGQVDSSNPNSSSVVETVGTTSPTEAAVELTKATPKITRSKKTKGGDPIVQEQLLTASDGSNLTQDSSATTSEDAITETEELLTNGKNIEMDIVEEVVKVPKRRGRPPKNPPSPVSTPKKSHQQSLLSYLPPSEPTPEYPHPQARPVYISDLKTRNANSLPSSSSSQSTQTSIQLMLYHHLLSNLLTDDPANIIKKVAELHKLSPSEPFSDSFIAQIAGLDPTESSLPLDTLLEHNSIEKLYALYHKILVNIVKSVKPELTAIYRWQSDASVIGCQKYTVDKPFLQRHIQNVMSWWKGERKTVGVEIEEAWKCRSCEFAEDCEWRLKKIDEGILERRRRKGLFGKVAAPDQLAKLIDPSGGKKEGAIGTT